jgi:hypothetical protein
VALLVGDPHVQRHAWAGRPEIQGDADFAIFELTRLAEEFRPQAVVLLGDVFDSYHPCPEDLHSLVYLSDQVTLDLNLDLWYLRGQHDLGKWSGKAGKPWMSLVPYCRHMHRASARLGPVRFYGLDFCHQQELQKELTEIPVDTDVLLAHQVWKEQMPAGATCEGSFTDVPHARIVATGDMHGHRSSSVVGASGQPLVALSPGTISMQAIDEDGDKFVYLLYEDLTFESVPLRSRSVLRYSCRTEEQLDQVVQQLTTLQPRAGLPEKLATPIVEVSCLRSLKDARSRLEEAALGHGHFFYRVLPQEEEKQVQPVRDPRQSIPLADLAQQRAPDLAPQVLRLACTLNPVTEVQQLVEDLRKEATIPTTGIQPEESES